VIGEEIPGHRRRSAVLLVLAVAVIGWGVSGYALRIREGVSDRGDPLLTAWIIAWNQHQILGDPLRLFQANIFHPFSDTLAYSEHIFGPAMLASPARLFTDNPVAVQNFSFLTAFLALGIAAFLLFRHASGDPLAAAFGAVLVALAPVRFPQLGHIQMLHSWGIPLLIYALWRYLETGRRAFQIAFLGALLFEMLTSFYLAIMALLCAGLVAALSPSAFGTRRVVEASRRLLPGLAVVGVLFVPFMLPYWKLRNQLGFVRSLEDNVVNWAGIRFYFRPYPGSVAAKISAALGFPPGGSTYLGVATLVLAVIGLVAAAKRFRPQARHRFAALYFFALGAVAFTLSLGAWRTIAGKRVHLPFYWLHRLPGLDGIRATVRFSILVDIAVVGLAVLGLATIHTLLRARGSTLVAAGIVGAAGLLAVVERTPRIPVGPLERIEVGADAPHVYRWLAHDPGAKQLIELPMGVGPGPREPWDVVPYKQVFYSTIHWRRIVNGTSGYQPPGYGALSVGVSTFPSTESLRFLRMLPIDRVVVHRRLYPFALSRRVFETTPGFRVLHECGDDFVVEVRREEIRRPDVVQPHLRLLSKSDGERRVRVKLEWTGDLPRFLYPPLGYRMMINSTDESGRERARASRQWLAWPRGQQAFAVSAGPDARSVSIVVAMDTGQKTSARWTFSPSSFYTLTPCRVFDSRRPEGSTGPSPLTAGKELFFPLAGRCGIPAGAKAIAANVTVLDPTESGDVRFFTRGGAPSVSSVNYAAGRSRANNAILGLGADGALGVVCAQPPGSVHVVIDVSGYFQ